MRPVVIVMVKAPRAGLAKTRLVSPLAATAAAELAACFVQDTVHTALSVVPELIVAYAPADARITLAGLLPAGLLWVEQQGVDLGERLEQALAHAARLGFGPLIVVGADSPTLPAAYIETARAALSARQAEAALGPTADGGYYLVALSQPVQHLFQGIAWSTPLAYEQTARNIAAVGLRLLQLPRWYDVDTFADLIRLRDEILTSEEARQRAPATSRWLLAHALPPAPPG